MVPNNGTVKPFWFHFVDANMPISLTLQNIPDDLYERLKAVAALHHRSLNEEAITCLASALQPYRMAPATLLARARALRAGLPQGQFTAEGIDAAKRLRSTASLLA
jgi:plasmid stability protein